MKTKILGPVVLLLTAMIWGTGFVAQRAGMDYIEPLTFTAARMILAAIALGIPALSIAVRNRKMQPPKTEKGLSKKARRTLIGGIGCGAFLSTATIFQQFGIVDSTAGKAGFITALYMLLVPILNLVLFRKKGTWLVWLAVLIGVGGMYLLCMNERFQLAPSDALLCVCALLFSCHILVCDRFVGQVDPIQLSAVQFATASMISTVAAFIAEQPTPQKIMSAAVPILYCGLISGGVGYTLQMVGQKYTDATPASLLMSLESVFAVLAGAIILRERMSLSEALGCVILFSAIILVQIPLPENKKYDKEKKS